MFSSSTQNGQGDVPDVRDSTHLAEEKPEEVTGNKSIDLTQAPVIDEQIKLVKVGLCK